MSKKLCGGVGRPAVEHPSKDEDLLNIYPFCPVCDREFSTSRKRPANAWVSTPKHFVEIPGPSANPRQEAS
jgi:hypothetical protein